jgi:CopG antitoxin of type II toxin-antitoxin system
MVKSRKQRDPIPEDFKSIEELQEFWDTHSVADYDDLFQDVEFDVDLRSHTNLVAVEPTLMQELVQRAHAMGISTETLVNLWLSKQLREAK